MMRSAAMRRKSSAHSRGWTRHLPFMKSAGKRGATHHKGGPGSYAMLDSSSRSYFFAPGKPVWTGRRYDRFADEAYMRNVIAHRSIAMVAQAAASVRWRLAGKDARQVVDHPAQRLLDRPNPCLDTSSLVESMVTYRLIAGNCYLHAVGPKERPPLELHLLRPDRVEVLAGRDACGLPAGYRYSHAKGHTDYLVSPATGRSRVLHWKQFHPLNDWYGLSSVEAAAYSIDQHNQAAAWNQSLLQQGARPSGALVVKAVEGGNGTLSEEQYQRLKTQIDTEFSGSANAGRPLLLEGGLDWREMSISPKDMDFIDAKHSSARDIALAFGVPPQLLGIPGDNTYSNMKEARLALWEQTVLPLLDNLSRSLTGWLLPFWSHTAYGGLNVRLDYERESIPALLPRREALWERISKADFLSDEEKRELLL